MNSPITFPVSTETFAAYQENGLGRTLLELERETVVAWLPIINGAYQDGASGDTQTIQDTTAHMRELIAQNSANALLHRFLRATLLWILRAWTQGFTEYNAEKGDTRNDDV